MTKPSVAATIAVAAAVLVLAAVVSGGCSNSQRIATEAAAVSLPELPVPVAEKSWLDRQLEGYFDPEEVATMSRDQKAICMEAVREMEGDRDDGKEVKKPKKK